MNKQEPSEVIIEILVETKGRFLRLQTQEPSLVIISICRQTLIL